MATKIIDGRWQTTTQHTDPEYSQRGFACFYEMKEKTTW